MYRGKYHKALTFSFDDGAAADRRLAELLNKYEVKGTFNLNGGKLSRAHVWITDNETIVRHLNYQEIGNSYEPDTFNKWDAFEDFPEHVFGWDDIFYCTNSQAFKMAE